MMKKNQQGFGALEVALLLVVIAVVGFGSYYVGQHHNQKSNLPEGTNSATGGPAPGHVVATEIKLVTGVYTPTNVDVKKGSTVTWEIADTGQVPNHGIASNSDSAEQFDSKLMRPGNKFSHTFNKTGVFGWHDQYDGNLGGKVTVTD
jgi:plastocyanin